VLSHDEERRLREIERRLLSEDPDMARRMGRPPVRRPSRLATLLLVVGAIGLLIGIVATSGALVVLLGLLPLAAGYALRRRDRSGP
jgi:uncharacterized membrane protein YphA (DoxX/SURF4 family)